MRKLILPFIFTWLCLTIHQNVSAENQLGPVDQLKPTIEEIIAILKEPEETLQPENKLDRIMDVADDAFDFQEMSKRVLGRNWQKLSVHEQEYFVQLFPNLLKYAYISQISAYTNQTIRFTRQQIKGNRAGVQTVLVDGDLEIPITYIMQLEDDRWLIYDVKVEGVSLLRNYREQFQAVLRKNDFSTLTKIIEEKITELSG